MQKYVPVTLLRQYTISLSISNQEEWCVYDTMKYHFVWLHIASDVHTTVKECRSCTHYGFKMKHNHKLQDFPAFGLPKFVAIDMCGPLPNTHWVANKWISWPTIFRNPPIHFSPGKLHRCILVLCYRKNGYFDMVSRVMYWQTTAPSSLANSSRCYAFP